MTIAWRYLPKVGSHGLALSPGCLREDWSAIPQVANYMRKWNLENVWFQTCDVTGWNWTHGMLQCRNGQAYIIQIG